MKSSAEQSRQHSPLWKIRVQRFTVLGLILLVIGAGMDLFVMPWYTRQDANLQLVNTIGMTVSDAQDLLMREGYRIEEIEKTDPKAPPGTIILQAPKAGTTVKVGRKVYLTVSKGLAPVVVPRIQGSKREAQLLIKNANLRMGRVDWDVSDYYPEGVVMFQSLPTGSRVQSGSYIDITISLGRVERSRTVPDVRNLNIEAAIKMLVKSGLNGGRVDTAVYTSLLPNTVLWQDRMPGEISMLGDTINLIVNTIDSTYQARRLVINLLDSLVRAQGLEP